MNPKLTMVTGDWRTLNEHLYKLKEAEVLELLEHEKRNKQRKVFLERLHQRFTTLRAVRERALLLRSV